MRWTMSVCLVLAKTGAGRHHRAMVAIRSRDELAAWLDSKSRATSAVIVLRAALRVLPLACNPARLKNRHLHPALTAALVRALAISEVVGNYPTADAARAVADAARAAADAASAANAAARAAADAAYTGARVTAEYAAASATRAGAVAAAYAATRAASAPFAPADWGAIEADCAEIERSGADTLHARPLWPRDAPD